MIFILPLIWILCGDPANPPCHLQDPYAVTSPTPTVASPTNIATPTPSSTVVPTDTPTLAPTPTPTSTPTSTGTPTPIPSPSPPSLSHTFWFHDPLSVDTFLAGNPVGGISIGNYGLTKQAQADLAHSKGLAVLGGITGSPGIYAPNAADSLAFIEHNVLDPLIAQKVDGLYVDEPMGQSLNDPRECGPGCFTYGQPLTPAATTYLVTTYNTLFGYIKSALPSIKVGICMSVVDFHQKTLAAGLNADFVCMESYGASTPGMLNSIKVAFPNIKTMMLVYGSFPLCEQLHWGLATIDYVALWNIDNYLKWIAGGGVIPAGPNEFDSLWAQRAASYVNGDTSFCPALLKQPSTDPYKIP